MPGVQLHYIFKPNVEKSVLALFGSQKSLQKFKDHDIPFKLTHEECTTNISSLNISAIRCLGVYFDENLTMFTHITHLKKYCYCQLHYLYCVKTCLTAEVKIKLVKGLVLSKIDFCHAVFINLPKYQLLIIHQITNSCLRYIYNLSHDESVSSYYLKSHILPIEYRLQYKACMTTFKCIYNIAPSCLSALFTPYTPLPCLTSEVLNLFCLVYPFPKKKVEFTPSVLLLLFQHFKLKFTLVFSSENLPPR